MTTYTHGHDGTPLVVEIKLDDLLKLIQVRESLRQQLEQAYAHSNRLYEEISALKQA